YGGDVAFSDVTFTLPPSTTAFVDTSVSFVRTPRAADTLNATFSFNPGSPTELNVPSPAPAYTGPRGVDLDFTVKQRRARSQLLYAVKGTVAAARTGRVTLWAYAPGHMHATAVAKA